MYVYMYVCMSTVNRNIHPSMMPAASVNLSIIDLSGDISASSAKLRQACLDSGFFYVVNHGIDRDLIQEVLHQSRKFFELPLSEKAKCLRNQNHRGYTPLFDETLDPSRQFQGDSKEGYYIGVEAPKDSHRASLCFYGPNIWPSEDLLPGWRDTMETYHKKTLNVASKICRLIALALNLEPEFFEKTGMMDNPMAFLRLLHYSGEKSIPEKGIFGAGAHSDWGFLTLIICDGTPGLQICRDKDEKSQLWESVEPVEGAFIVNLGDMLERWTNNIFRSTLHRVLISGKERYSIAFFLHGNYECSVECLETCQSEANPPKFPPVTNGEYLLERYGESHSSNPDSLIDSKPS